jgi:hypothetical protein
MYMDTNCNTPIRPDYSSDTVRLRAELMPVFERFIELQHVQVVEVVDDVTEVIELDEVA